MYSLKVHKQFIKDLKKSKLNPSNTEKLFVYINLLINGKNLPVEARDHSLKGEWSDTREFHVSGDLIVIYR
ncbi:MAG: type II toxin-antitoxin system YafQ family toxin, partial [Aquificae bacterium]|nr:type II toxin-antitoxin system YafQ family toxin [Aquificota bacterium]